MEYKIVRKRRINRTAVLFGLFTVALISVCATGMWSTFAWFAFQRTNSATLQHVAASSPDTIQVVNFYPCRYHKEYKIGETENTAMRYEFSETALPTGQVRDLGPYGVVNQNHNALLIELVLTPLALNSSTLYFSAETLAEKYLGNVASEADYLQANGNSLSSVIEFYAFLGDSITEGTTTDPKGAEETTLYYCLDTADSTKNSFVGDLDPATETRNLIKEVALPIDGETVIDGTTVPEALTGNKSLFIILDYDVMLIEEIYSANLTNPTLYDYESLYLGDDNNYYITYECDFFYYVRTHVEESA